MPFPYTAHWHGIPLHYFAAYSLLLQGFLPHVGIVMIVTVCAICNSLRGCCMVSYMHVNTLFSLRESRPLPRLCLCLFVVPEECQFH